MANVKCQDCRFYINGRCEVWMRYRVSDKPRHCQKFQSKTQTTLLGYESIWEEQDEEVEIFFGDP